MATALKLERIKNGMKQWRLATILGIHPQELSAYEVGRKLCPYEIRVRIARILDVPVENIFPEQETQ